MCFLASLVAMVLLCTGCASFSPPKPWEKAELAKTAMQFDADVLDAKVRERTFSSKEGAAGGYAVGGGGCGCN